MRHRDLAKVPGIRRRSVNATWICVGYASSTIRLLRVSFCSRRWRSWHDFRPGVLTKSLLPIVSPIVLLLRLLVNISICRHLSIFHCVRQCPMFHVSLSTCTSEKVQLSFSCGLRIHLSASAILITFSFSYVAPICSCFFVKSHFYCIYVSIKTSSHP